ncbi:retrovirus-related pol polyprotein from transposon TNT 1-94 [Tanacetum coccineum]|uniref:Retrovirus-related pol polyprotein from transposon TNT 1-94 n=1 Tax=Tanacetum coccineum TaxID=301880 RepID=A0ABQ5IJ84_9ASTR
MTSLAEHIIVARAKNRPLMLEKSMYDSWTSRIRLFIKWKKNGRTMLDSIDNGPLVYPTVEENRQTRPKKYSELTKAQQLQDDCDVQAINIILHSLPPDVRFSQLINDMHTIRMTMQQVQVNTKFLNALLPEWSKFVTDVKLAKSLYTTNMNQLQPLKMEKSQFNKFKKDKLRGKGTWQNSALSQRGQEILCGSRRRSGYQQKDQINQCQMTKHEQEWKDCAKSRSKVQNMAKVRVYTEESSVNTWSAELKITNECNLTHPEWPKSSIDPILAQLQPISSHSPIHHQHHHTLVNPQQQSVSLQPFISLRVTQQSQAEFPQLDSGLAVPTFQQGEDLIDCINKAMKFLFVVVSRFPPSNNKLRTSSNPRNQITIQYERVTVQQVQERQTQSFVGTGNKGIATTSRRNYTAGQAKVVKCYNCLREGHMVKQCPQPKRPRSSAWFKEKLMLAETQEASQILDEEQLAFIADPRITDVQVAQQTIPQNSAFQTEDLDAYDSDCDDISSAKAVLMANLSSCISDVLYEVPYSDTYLNDMINQDVQEMSYSEQTHIVNFLDNEITRDSNSIPYSQYMQE